MGALLVSLMGAAIEFAECRGVAGTGEPLPPQNASHGAAYDRPADRTAHLAADRLADVGGDLPGHAVADRAGNLARDDLPGRKPRSAWAIGSEYAPEHVPQTAQHRAKPAGRLGLSLPAGRMRRADRTACSAGL